MARLVIVGGGFAGLALAAFSARRGHEAVVVDRDGGPPEGPADVLATWARPGVAQASSAHYFLARSTRVLREELPELLDAFVAVGIQRSSARFGPGMEDDVALTARRPVYEAVLRRFVEDEPGVQLRQGSVRGLLAASRSGRRVTGVELDDGGELHGDLVVDAAGRRSASGRWLRQLGAAVPTVADDPCELHYYGRHYRLRADATYPRDEVPIVQPLPYAVLLVFIGDNRTFSVAVAISAHDPLRRRLQDPEAFERFLGAVPTVAEWVDRAEPISELTVMAGLSNRRRHLSVDGRPVVEGLVLVGDASLYTNPALGQGVSLTLWMVQHLADLVERSPDDAAGVTGEHEAWVERELGSRYERQVLADRENTRQFEAGRQGAGFLPPRDPRVRYLRAAAMLAADDQDLAIVTRRVGHLLQDPRVLWDDPAIAGRIEAFLSAAPAIPPGHGPLPRPEFETLVGA